MEHLPVSDHNSSAARKAEFSRREVDDVKLISYLPCDRSDRNVLVLLFTDLVEVQIVLKQGSIEKLGPRREIFPLLTSLDEAQASCLKVKTL